MKDKKTLMTPLLTLPFPAFLHSTDPEFEKRFSRTVTLKDGTTYNSGQRYRITGDAARTDPETQTFLLELEKYREANLKPGTSHAKLPVREGTKRYKSNDGKVEYLIDKNLARLDLYKVANKGKIPLFENGQRVGSSKEILPIGTQFRVELEAIPYNFTGEDGKEISGIKLDPLSIYVENRPEPKSFPNKKPSSSAHR